MRILKIAALLILALFVYEGVDRQFRFGNVYFADLKELPLQQNKEEQSLDNFSELLQKQLFTYLDRGKQSFVFVSEDQQYVLKLFDSKALKPSLARFNFFKNFEKKQKRLFNGYRLAFEQDREHTGIIALHFPEMNRLQNPLIVVCIDRFGFKHSIDLNLVPFVIQKKAIPTRNVISELLWKGDIAAAKERLSLILEMYVAEYHKGIYDRDHNFMYNTGFIEQQPIRLDVGRLYFDEKMKTPSVYLADLKKIAIGRLGGWLSRHFPQYREEILDWIRSEMASKWNLSIQEEPSEMPGLIAP